MKDEEVYKKIKEYFKVQELVSKKVYKRYGETSWKFLSPRLLHTLLVIREGIGKPITINTWHVGGRFSQRGLRSNLGSIFMSKFKKGALYLSGHVLGIAVDFDVKGMTAPQVRDWIEDNADKLPYKVRLEDKMKGKPISWVHIDLIWESKNPKVYRFNV